MNATARRRRSALEALAAIYVWATANGKALYVDIQDGNSTHSLTLFTGVGGNWREVDKLEICDGSIHSRSRGAILIARDWVTPYLKSLPLGPSTGDTKAELYGRTFAVVSDVLLTAIDHRAFSVESTYHGGWDAQYLTVRRDGRDVFAIAEDGHAALVAVPEFVPFDDACAQTRWAVALVCQVPQPLKEPNSICRRAARLLLAVHELHKRGFQNLFLRCYMSASGHHWRCELLGPGGDLPIATYSSADEADYFELRNISGANFKTLADRIAAEFQGGLEAARGWNFENAGWVASLIPWVQAGLLPVEFSDFENPSAYGLIQLKRADERAEFHECYLPLPPARLKRLVESLSAEPGPSESSASRPLDFGNGIGVDGCRGGWFWVRIVNGSYKHGVAKSFTELCESYPDGRRICVDIPIGLPDDEAGRRCDAVARSMLKSRASSVFSAPARAVLRAESYDQAKQLSREAIGKALPKQAYAIVPKIREVDEALQGNHSLRERVIEGHPEVSFLGLSGKPMQHPKKTKEGFDERVEVLERHWPNAKRCIDGAMSLYPRKTVARDDIVDAVVLAIAAASKEVLNTLPDTPALDRTGLPMRMCYLKL